MLSLRVTLIVACHLMEAEKHKYCFLLPITSLYPSSVKKAESVSRQTGESQRERERE